MMLGFRVHYDGYNEIFDSIVYAIDTDDKKFLVVNDGGWFKWVKCSDCQLIREPDASEYIVKTVLL